VHDLLMASADWNHDWRDGRPCAYKISIYCYTKHLDQFLKSTCASAKFRSAVNQVHKLGVQFVLFICKTGLMLRMLRLLSIFSARFFCSRCDLFLENLVLRQQLALLNQ
jgi:hypothetical protein